MFSSIIKETQICECLANKIANKPYGKKCESTTKVTIEKKRDSNTTKKSWYAYEAKSFTCNMEQGKKFEFSLIHSKNSSCCQPLYDIYVIMMFHDGDQFDGIIKSVDLSKP